MIGETPITGRLRIDQCVADAGDLQDRADAHDRVGRRENDEVGSCDRFKHARCGARLRGTDRDDALRGYGGMQPDPPLLKVHGPLAVVRIVENHMGFDRVVRHRQQSHARCPSLAQPTRDFGQRHAVS